MVRFTVSDGENLFIDLRQCYPKTYLRLSLAWLFPSMRQNSQTLDVTLSSASDTRSLSNVHLKMLQSHAFRDLVRQ